MQVSVETTSGLERRVTVGVPAEKVDAAVENKLREAQKNVRLDGFRPGKVPMREVKRRFGAAVRNEVLADVMRESFLEAVEQEKLQPAGMPGFEATKNEAGKDLEFVATFEVFPEVELAPFDSIEVEKPVAEVTDADVDQMIETLREQRAEYQEVDRAAENGDRVNIDFKGLKDGEAFEGGSAEGQNLELGSGQMIPGFEDGIVGMKAGDEKDIDVTFPRTTSPRNCRARRWCSRSRSTRWKPSNCPRWTASSCRRLASTTATWTSSRRKCARTWSAS
ncbi:Trigger factor [Alcanivorax sp. ALC70]|nr:Trigger factor [Alcanivorax sp. ALC70]